MSKLGQAFEILSVDDGLRDEGSKIAHELQHSDAVPRAECGPIMPVVLLVAMLLVVLVIVWRREKRDNNLVGE
jgi:hypothetical protein